MVTAYGGRCRPHSRYPDVRTLVCWMTTVVADIWPASVVCAGAPSIQTSQRLVALDQRKVKLAAGSKADSDETGRPPGGAGPNLKPMSCALLAPFASASSSRVRANRL